MAISQNHYVEMAHVAWNESIKKEIGMLARVTIRGPVNTFDREYKDIDDIIYEEHWLHLYRTLGQLSINLKETTVLNVEEIDCGSYDGP